MLSRRKITEAIAERLVVGESKVALMEQLAAYLTVHKLTKQASVYIADIERQLADRGHIVVDVTSAHTLDDELRGAIKAQFSSDNDVTLREHLDTSLIGGVIVRTPTHEFDGSISTTLRDLRTS